MEEEDKQILDINLSCYSKSQSHVIGKKIKGRFLKCCIFRLSSNVVTDGAH